MKPKYLLIVLSLAAIIAIISTANYQNKTDVPTSEVLTSNTPPVNNNSSVAVAEPPTTPRPTVKPIKPDLSASRRVVPDTEIDHRLKNAQEVIESQGYGTFPPVDMSKMNHHKEYVLQALQNPVENSGAISIVGKRQKFDLERYKSDPPYYLDTVEPGRAFDAADPVEGVKPIERVGNSSIRTKQNETVRLEAKAGSNMPVSFTSFDGGHFQNDLGFITLQADANGIASAEFTPTDGVINQTRIRAASPVSSGTLQWTVFVGLNDNQ